MVKISASASKVRPKTDIAIGVQATYKHTVVHNKPAKYHKFKKQCPETVLQEFTVHCRFIAVQCPVYNFLR